MSLQTYSTAAELMGALAEQIAAELSETLAGAGSATLAVPGGTTPGPLFDQLCTADLPWAQINVMLSDERWVPIASPRSNTRLLQERLLVARASEARYLPLYASSNEIDAALPALEAQIAPALPLSVLLLGMGADMHTASLFPGAQGLPAALASDAPLLMPMHKEGLPEPRITLTARALNTAQHKHVLILGAEKREAYEKALTLSPQEAPICAVLPGATVHWAP